MLNSYLISSVAITISTSYIILNLDNLSPVFLVLYILFFLALFIKLFLKLHDYHDVINRILEVSYNCIFIKDSKGRYKLANRALLNLYGLKKRKEIIGKTDPELAERGIISNYEALRCKEEDRIVLSGKRSKTFPVNEFRSINGSTHIYQVIKTPFNSIKSRNNIIGVSIDITQRKKIESDLQKSEISNKMIIESSPYGILVLDSKGNVISYNNILSSITGFNKIDIRCKEDITDKIITSESDKKYFNEIYERIHKNLKYMNRTIKLKTKSGDLKFAGITMCLLPNDSTAMFIKDITAEVEVERKIFDAKNSERRRIVTEIHDIIGHSLTSLYMMTEATKDLIGVDNDKAKDLVDHASIQIQSSTLDLKMVLNMLENIDDNDSFGFDNIIKLLDFFEKLTGVGINLEISDTIKMDNLEKYIDNCFFRIIQEGLTNAVKHSKAACINIFIYENSGYYNLIIKNDGLQNKKIIYGVGLRGITERVEKIKGSAETECRENMFILKVKVPVNGLEEKESE